MGSMYLCTYTVFHLLLHSGGHHDDTDDGDQQEVEGVHESGPRGLFDLGAAVAAARTGRWATAAGQLYAVKEEEMGNTLSYQFHDFPHCRDRLVQS